MSTRNGTLSPINAVNICRLTITSNGRASLSRLRTPQCFPYTLRVWAHLSLLLCALPFSIQDRATSLSSLAPARLLCIQTDFPKYESLCTRHRNDIALKRPVQHAPFSLIDREQGLSVVLRVLVCLGHDPCWCVRDSLSCVSCE